MATVQANGIRIEYDVFGDRNARPLLLIMGLGGQMIQWHEEFCQALADRGHFVIRFDNRDIGLSEKIESAGVPDVAALVQALQERRPLSAPYTLDDMADDAAGLMDALGLESANVCGASMGGMIAQTLAIRHPQRVRSLVSIMSTTGDPSLPQGRPEAMQFLLRPAPAQRQRYVEHAVELWRTIGSPGFPFEEEEIRRRAALAFDRCFYPAGQVRQLAAILAHGDRTEGLRRVRVPALVIHGTGDPLVPVECGRATAAAIPGAELLLIEGMGHDLPRGAWPRIVEAINRVTR